MNQRFLMTFHLPLKFALFFSKRSGRGRRGRSHSAVFFSFKPGPLVEPVLLAHVSSFSVPRSPFFSWVPSLPLEYCAPCDSAPCISQSLMSSLSSYNGLLDEFPSSEQSHTSQCAPVSLHWELIRPWSPWRVERDSGKCHDAHCPGTLDW